MKAKTQPTQNENVAGYALVAAAFLFPFATLLVEYLR